MLNLNKIFVYDYETDHKEAPLANPVDFAAKVYDPRLLTPIPDGEFQSFCRPPDIDEPDYKERHLETIEWHSKKDKMEVDDIIAKWKTYPNEKLVWDQFVTFIKKYNNDQKRKSAFSGPIRAGWNIRNYDNIITNRLCQKYGNSSKTQEQNLFHPRDVIDGLDLSFYWFENLGGENSPAYYNMDYLREYFGLKSEDTHTALTDVRDSGVIIIKFLQLHRRFSKGIAFKNALVNHVGTES